MMRLWLGLCLALTSPLASLARESGVHVAAVSGPALREWSDRVDGLVRSGLLAVRQTREDTMIPGRQHERLVQLHQGVPVFGAELARQSDGAGTLTVFGSFYQQIDVPTIPSLRPRDVEASLAARGARPFGSRGGPELMVLPLEDGTYRLTYRTRVFFEEPFGIRQIFTDASTGEVVFEYDDLQSQMAGIGTGVLGDQKKLSVSSTGGLFSADDKLRPPVLRTYDFRFDLARFVQFLNQGGGPWSLTAGDLAQDADNAWTDGAVVDAHAYAGLTYDYFFKRHGRRGLDNANIPIHSITHALRREDWRLYTSQTIGTYFVNAFYLGDGVMYYGDGLPPGLSWSSLKHNYYAGALDIVAHELSHGVTDYSSQLIYWGDSGALNEAFSDIMATSVEFYFQPDKADYLLGEDVATPGGFRSMQNPMSYGHPDHYSTRYTGSADNGGVHINSSIANHAFYLAIEGGRHRLGTVVNGVGAANREQIERVFYRAFTSFLGPRSGFLEARNATLQAARELYGGNATVETAVDQAWRAVGIQ